MPLNLTQFNWTDYEKLVNFLFANTQFTGKTLLVAWEHRNIEEAVGYLLKHDYNYAGALPSWNGNDYDSIWKIAIDPKGNLTVSSDCEGITSSTFSLPAYCP